MLSVWRCPIGPHPEGGRYVSADSGAFAVSGAMESDRGGGTTAAIGREWLATLPGELSAQRHIMAELIELSDTTPIVTSLSVGCSIGRGAADELSDVDAAIGIDTERGAAGARQIEQVESMIVEALPILGAVVDVLQHRTGPADRLVRRIFAQFADGMQLDLAVMAEVEVRRGAAAPDFVTLYRAAEVAGNDAHAGDRPARADVATPEQIREWAFFGWCALADVDKYLRRGSVWEAHNRLHEARHHIWALWATANGALYPWHGLSQVLDQDPRDLPPGIETTIAGLDPVDLLRAARASATLLTHVSKAAAARYAANLPSTMDGYVTSALARDR